MLKDLTNNSPILGAAIFSVEGLPLVSHFYGGTEEVTIAAMVAGMYGAGELSVKELKQGNLKSIIVEGDYGKTVVIAITDGYLLTVTAPENAKLGLVFNDSKRFAREAGKLLRGLI
jgi:predicted regulator of Ras-like GTPase activity (Roadblock/LC7/MglB family)